MKSKNEVKKGLKEELHPKADKLAAGVPEDADDPFVKFRGDIMLVESES